MAKFVIESPHTAEECLTVLDESLDQGVIENFVFGCKTGDHTAWAYVTADSKEEALENVPEVIRDKAYAYEVGKFSEEEIEAAHK